MCPDGFQVKTSLLSKQPSARLDVISDNIQLSFFVSEIWVNGPFNQSAAERFNSAAAPPCGETPTLHGETSFRAGDTVGPYRKWSIARVILCVRT